MVPANYRPRRGDIVVLHAEVKHDFDEGDAYVHLLIDGRSATTLIARSEISGVKRRIWNEEEEVQHKANPKIYGTVVAMSGYSVWVKLDTGSDQKGSQGGHRTFHCNELVPFGNETLLPAVAASLPITDHEPFPDNADDASEGEANG